MPGDLIQYENFLEAKKGRDINNSFKKLCETSCFFKTRRAMINLSNYTHTQWVLNQLTDPSAIWYGRMTIPNELEFIGKLSTYTLN